MTYDDLKQAILTLTAVPEADLDPDGDLIDYGLDSIQVLGLIEQWQESGINVEFAELSEDRTLNGWWRLLESRRGASS